MTHNPYPADSLARLQECEVEILCAIDSVCRDEGIQYFITSGSLLGAVRHGGFIPWDDDMDIGMPVEDYRRFLEVAPNLLREKGLSIHTALNTKTQADLWAKVSLDGTRFIDDVALQAGYEQGIFVDVFPFYVLDEDEAVAKRQVSKATWLQRKSYLHHIPYVKTSRGPLLAAVVRMVSPLIFHTIARTWTAERLLAEMDEVLATSNPGKKMFCPSYARYIHHTDNLLPPRPIPFGPHEFLGPANPDAALKTYYGDYTQLPPEEKRYTHAPLILDFGDGINVIANNVR